MNKITLRISQTKVSQIMSIKEVQLKNGNCKLKITNYVKRWEANWIIVDQNHKTLKWDKPHKNMVYPLEARNYST